MDKQKIQNMIAALEIFYETAGYEDFYEKEIKCRTDDEIYMLYEDTFGEEI
ncbi:MAG: hypothetical protein HFE62_03980 [Firmicutes bacterium]|nr:hypothetical protein [Bacillota bacterium]